MVRLIIEYTDYHFCEMDKNLEQLVQDQKQQIGQASTIISKIIKQTQKIKPKKNNTNAIKCFPNPATDHIMIEINKPIDLICLMSSNGKIISQIPKAEVGQIRLNLSNYPSGLYFLHFFNQGKHFMEKVIIGNG